MREIQAAEVETRLAKFLQVVEQGEVIAITQNGRTVAHLVPAMVQDHTNRAKAVEEFRQRRSRWEPIALTTDEIFALHHEGHDL